MELDPLCPSLAKDYKQLAKRIFCWQKFIFNLASFLKKMTSWSSLYSKAYLNLYTQTKQCLNIQNVQFLYSNI